MPRALFQWEYLDIEDLVNVCNQGVYESLSLNDPVLLGGVLVRYLQELPDPLLTASLAPQWVAVIGDEKSLSNLFKRLPALNQALLKVICAMCRQVSSHPQYQTTMLQLSHRLLPVLLGAHLPNAPSLVTLAGPSQLEILGSSLFSASWVL